MTLDEAYEILTTLYPTRTMHLSEQITHQPGYVYVPPRVEQYHAVVWDEAGRSIVLNVQTDSAEGLVGLVRTRLAAETVPQPV